MLAEQYVPALRAGYDMFNAGVKICGIGNTQIAPLTTVSGSGTTSLQGMFTVLAPPNYPDLGRQIGNAMVDLKSIGVLNDTNVGTADTVTGLRNIIAAADPTSSLSGTAYIHFQFPI